MNTLIQTYLNMPEAILLNDIETFGITIKSILNELEEVFPDEVFTPEDTMEKIMYRSGQRSVVEWIKQRMEED